MKERMRYPGDNDESCTLWQGVGAIAVIFVAIFLLGAIAALFR